MKLDTVNKPTQTALQEPNVVQLQEGLVGFSDLTSMEVVFSQEEEPFLRLRDKNKKGQSFVVVEPFALVPDYSIEILDDDVESLDIRSPNEVLVLNIVTFVEKPKKKVLTNLVGPVVINRRNLKAKQIVIGNYQDYSARHTLYEEGKENNGAVEK